MPILRVRGQRCNIPTGEDGAAAGGDRSATRVLHLWRDREPDADQRRDAALDLDLPAALHEVVDHERGDTRVEKDQRMKPLTFAAAALATAAELIQRGRSFVGNVDLVDSRETPPLGLIAQTVLERPGLTVAGSTFRQGGGKRQSVGQWYRFRQRAHRVEGRRDAAPPLGSPQPVVADQVSVLPNVPGQAASGHGAGSASVPAASEAARYV